MIIIIIIITFQHLFLPFLLLSPLPLTFDKITEHFLINYNTFISFMIALRTHLKTTTLISVKEIISYSAFFIFRYMCENHTHSHVYTSRTYHSNEFFYICSALALVAFVKHYFTENKLFFNFNDKKCGTALKKSIL